MKINVFIITILSVLCLNVSAQTPKGFHDYFHLENLYTYDHIGAPWSIEKDHLIVLDDGQNSFLLKKDFNCGNLIIETAFDVLMSHEHSRGGVAFRISSGSQSNQLNGYFAGITPKTNTIFLAKIVNGNETILAKSEIEEKAYGGWLRVKANGTRIRVYFNNVLKIDTNDGSFSTGRVGLRVFRARLDAATLVTVENMDAKQEIIKGGDWNYLAFNSDLKKALTLQAQRGETFGPTNMIVTNFSVLKDFVDDKFGHITNTYDRASAIYDWIINNLYYDRDASSRTPVKVLSTFPLDVFEKRVTNCTGYASLFASFLNLSGIPAILAGGPTDQGGNMHYEGDHIWLEAFIDGQWRLMDPTFDSSNDFRAGKKNNRPNNNQWKYFDTSLADFSKVHRINRYFFRTLGSETPLGDLDSDTDIAKRKFDTPKGKTEWTINQVMQNKGTFYWRCAMEEWELAPDTKSNLPGNVVFNEIAASNNNKWKMTKAGVSNEGNLLVYIQHVSSNRNLKLIDGEDRIGTYIHLAEAGQQGTPFELVVKDNGSLQVLSPLRGVIMRAGNEANARLQRVSTRYDVLMTRFHFVIAD
jgi:hypothetical protein